MKSKLKTNLIIMELAFLLIAVGGSILVYHLFASSCYTSLKARMVREAFGDIREIDLSSLDEEDQQILESYEEKLHLVAKFLNAKKKVSRIHCLAGEFHKKKDESILTEIEEISNEILEEL